MGVIKFIRDLWEITHLNTNKKVNILYGLPDIEDIYRKFIPGDIEIADENIGLLTYIFRAWDSFYRAFDYTSTIHNAMKWPGDKHLTASIAGAFADAMYGCEMSFIKKKYAIIPAIA